MESIERIKFYLEPSLVFLEPVAGRIMTRNSIFCLTFSRYFSVKPIFHGLRNRFAGDQLYYLIELIKLYLESGLP